MSVRTIINIALFLLAVATAGPLNGCSDTVGEPNQIPPPPLYTGTWRLKSSVHSSEQKFIDAATIVFDAKQSFSASRSMFWRKDSFAVLPLSGAWTFHTGEGDPPFPAAGQAYITLTVEGESKSWTITGSRYEGRMQWYTSYPSFLEYEWTLIQ